MKISRMKINTQILLLVILLGILISAFILSHAAEYSNSNCESLINSTLKTAVTISQDFIGKDYHDKITNKNSVSPEEFNEIAGKYQEICSDLPLKYIWSVLMLNDETVVLTTATPPDETINDKHNMPKFFSEPSNPEIFIKAIRTEKPFRSTLKNEWGNNEIIIIPYKDSNGRNYAFCAGLDSTYYRKMTDNILKKHLISSIILILCIMLICYIFFIILTRPLKIITSKIQQISTKEYDYSKSKWAEEYIKLSDNIYYMYSEINHSYHMLRIQEEDLHTTLMCIGDGVIVTDERGNITRINSEAIRLTGWSENDAIDKDFYSVFTTYDKKDASSNNRQLDVVLLTGKMIELNRNTMLISKDQNEFHISGIFAPIITNNIVIGTVVTFKNLTLEDQQADKIRQNHEIMLDVLRLSRVSYWEYNIQDNTFWLSNDLVSLYGIEEIEEGLIDGDLLIEKYLNSDDTDNSLRLEFQQAIAEKKPFRLTKEFLNFQTKQPLFFDAAAIPILNSQGEVIKLIGLTKDITEHKTLTHQLYHSQKLDAVGQLTGGVAHDFNNMLGGIIGFAELLLNNLGDNDKLASYCNHIINTGENAAKLTSQLLSFARKGKSISTPVDVHKVIDSAVILLKRSFDKTITIDKQYNAATDTVIGDPSQIESVIINLGINARDAITERGNISIITELTELSDTFCTENNSNMEPGSYIVIRIKDDGSGMSQDTLDHIFEPFFTTKDEGKGTGLGLSVIHSIISAHKGYIEVNSEIGIGTEFKIYLPLSGDATIELNNAASDRIDKYSGKEGILVVDDEEIIQNMASALLQNLGYKVFIAGNGEIALKIYQEHRSEIAAVILDVVMPVMGGMTCLKELKALYPEIKVIIASGFSKSETSADFIKNGAAAFINKPYRQITLAKVIKNTLGK